MKSLFFIAVIAMLPIKSLAQTPDPILYGVIKIEDLNKAPYDQWFRMNYDDYHPASSVMQDIRKIDTKGVTIEIFMGTWCGDSRREVPRFLKIMDDLNFAREKITIIGLGGSDSLYKQSPQHEEQAKGIFRVPVFIMYKNGIEVNRINEFPVNSLERDLLAILSARHYQPNYPAFSIVRNWLANGSLADKNISSAGLAQQLRSFYPGEREMNALGYLLLGHDKKQEALKLFQVNANLYPESANVISSLGEGYYKNGDQANAIRYLERSLEMNKDPQAVKGILRVLYAAVK